MEEKGDQGTTQKTSSADITTLPVVCIACPTWVGTK